MRPVWPLSSKAASAISPPAVVARPAPPPGGLLRPEAGLRAAALRARASCLPGHGRATTTCSGAWRWRSRPTRTPPPARVIRAESAVRNESAVGMPGLVDRGVEHLPAVGVGVAEEGELGFGLCRSGRRPEGKLAGPDPDAPDRERQLPVAPRFAGLAARGGAHQRRLRGRRCRACGSGPVGSDRRLAAAGRGDSDSTAASRPVNAGQVERAARPHRFPLISLIRTPAASGTARG